METEDMINLPASSNSESEKDSIKDCNPDKEPGEIDSEHDILDVEMEIEDITSTPTSSNHNKWGSTEICKPDKEPGEIDSPQKDSLDRVIETHGKDSVGNDTENRYGNSHLMLDTDSQEKLFGNSSTLHMSVEVTKAIKVTESSDGLSSKLHVETGCLAVQGETQSCHQKVDGTRVLDVNRAQTTYDKQPPSVHVIYNNLTRASMQKLEELLQQWSQWHALHGSTTQEPVEVESGEKTYFPALISGVEKSSAVSFWIESQRGIEQEKVSASLDGNSVPLYDRGFALGLTSSHDSTSLQAGLEIIDDPARCFNCGSYSHALKECPRPRDNVAVNNARNQFKLKKSHNSASRSTRYYQSTREGKYDGLKPGSLAPETRQFLGIGELDPPPWLNRMREIGYPPAYLDLDDEDKPSGITIYDGDTKEDQEAHKIRESKCSEPKKKKTVEFPGINSPIPDNADEICWAEGPSSSGFSRNRSSHKYNHSLDSTSRGNQQDQRWSRGYNDVMPPGCEVPSMTSHPLTYGSHFSSNISHYSSGNRARSPTFPRSSSSRDRRSALDYDDLLSPGSYNYRPHSLQDRHIPRYSSDSANLIDERWDSYRSGDPYYLEEPIAKHRTDDRWNPNSSDYPNYDEERRKRRRHWD